MCPAGSLDQLLALTAFAGQSDIFFVQGNQEVALLLDKDGISWQIFTSSLCCQPLTFTPAR